MHRIHDNVDGFLEHKVCEKQWIESIKTGVQQLDWTNMSFPVDDRPSPYDLWLFKETDYIVVSNTILAKTCICFFFVGLLELVIHLAQTSLGACRVLIPVNVAQIPRLETLAISIVQMDHAPWGLS
ncbi:hypothetical protein MRB53_016176 [Persea americana]|uniref:Uncharacterized protein n=1 Tax=Persea americana TaxID=3435 RepID=A0ACC2M2Q6_PERAE|nr:hypothetical protein MRB53_016176 [Persea americana]